MKASFNNIPRKNYMICLKLLTDAVPVKVNVRVIDFVVFELTLINV